MLVGVGVDLLHLSRLRAILARRDPARLAGRILCTDELHEWRNLGGSTFQSERYLALRSVHLTRSFDFRSGTS